MKTNRQILMTGILILLSGGDPLSAQWSTDSTVNSPISTATGTHSFPVICSDGAGGAIASWSDSQPAGLYPDIMTVAQTARYLSVEEKTIRNWTSEGKIPFKKLGSSVRYKKSELDQELEKGAIG